VRKFDFSFLASSTNSSAYSDKLLFDGDIYEKLTSTLHVHFYQKWCLYSMI
jgi:hypothetical protein